ncbi:MAG: DEAD/DEAH box helicase [Planctomycetota bacterium]
MKLRDYQAEVVAADERAWQQHDRVMNVLPTGMGKTEIFVQVAKRWAEREAARERVLVVAPTIELVDQAAAKLEARTGVRPGIEQANRRSLEYSLYRSPFVVGSKPTLCGPRKRYERLDEIGLVIIDECHGATTKPVAEMLDWFVGQGAKVLGVTATPKRHDDKAMANIFDTCAYEMFIADAIPLGWLVPPVAKCVQIESMDLSTVATNGAAGDFKEGDLARAMEDERVVFEIAEVTARESQGLKTVVFCASVAEAKAVAYRLIDKHGVEAGWVCGDKKLCPPESRARILNSFTNDPNGIQIVTNVGVLTTGWDFPGLEHIVMARPTKSLSLYTQIFGRGTRPLPGVVDFDGSTPELRRKAIADSAKPTFKVTDLYDNSLEHKLVGAFDVMAGTMGLEVAKKAQENAEKDGGPVDVDEALAAAKQQIEDEKERKRLAAIKSAARYKSVDVDPMNPHQRAPRVASDRGSVLMNLRPHKGKPLSAVPLGFLRWGLQKGVWNRTPGIRDAVATEVARRSGQPRQSPIEGITLPAPAAVQKSIDGINAALLET